MTRQSLLTLLRMALWGEPLPLPGATDWAAVAAEARRQTVAGLVADAAGMLPADKRPPADVRLRLIAEVRRTELAYRRSADALGEILKGLNDKGVRPFLVKGLSVAERYREPCHRAVGDIDLVFADAAGLAKANAWARECGSGLDGFYAKHLAYIYKGVPVEHHGLLCSFASRRYTRRLREIAVRQLAEGKLPPSAFGGADELPATFYAFYLLCHMAAHALEDGLGLRQVCDWAVFLRSEAGHIDGCKFAEWAAALGLGRMAEAFGRICADDLGLDERCLPFALRRNDDKGYRLLLGQIWAGGNFGRQFYPYKGRVGKREDMLRTLLTKLPRYALMLRLWPGEAVCSYRALIVRGARRLAGGGRQS